MAVAEEEDDTPTVKFFHRFKASQSAASSKRRAATSRNLFSAPLALSHAKTTTQALSCSKSKMTKSMRNFASSTSLAANSNANNNLIANLEKNGNS